jgi:putative endopeptidase
MRYALGFPLLLLVAVLSGDRSVRAQARPDFLAVNVDITIAPGDDFFEYANGTWFKRNPIPEGIARWGIGDVLSEERDAQLRRIAEDAARKGYRPGSDEQLAGDFWSAAMDEGRLNREGLSPLNEDLRMISQIGSIEDLVNALAYLHRRSPVFNRPLFIGSTEPDEKNSGRWIYNLQQGGIGMSASAYAENGDARAARIRRAFSAYLVKTLLRIHGDQARAEEGAAAVFDFESRLATAFEPETGYRLMTVVELQASTPTMHWKAYLQRLGVTTSHPINVRHQRFFQTVDSLLQTTPLDTWKDYLRVWLLRVNAGFLDDATLEDFFAYDSTVTGALRPRPRWRRVIQQARNFVLSQPLARLYVKTYFAPAMSHRYELVGESIREAFGERIKAATWLTEATKRAALRKLQRLNITIGFGDLSTEFRTMDIRRDSYAQNVMRANEWLQTQEFQRIGRLVDNTTPELNPSWSDAEYNNNLNAIWISPGSMKVPPGWTFEELDDAFLYASTALGHEISHAFDSGGRLYDEAGNKVDWWTPAEVSAFNERTNLLIAQYDGFTVGLRQVDGRRALRENMADLTGLRVALDAFKKTAQFKNGREIAGFTPLQRFFLAYAYGFMQQVTPSILAAQVGGNYAPNRQRVNGVLMNIPEFYEAFDIKPGEAMYREPALRASIW